MVLCVALYATTHRTYNNNKHYTWFLLNLCISLYCNNFKIMKNFILTIALILGFNSLAQNDLMVVNMETMAAERVTVSGVDVLFNVGYSEATPMQIQMAQYVIGNGTEIARWDDEAVGENGEGVVTLVIAFEVTTNSGTIFRLFLTQAEGYDEQAVLTRRSNLKEL